MLIVDALTHFVPPKPVPHCNSYDAFTTLFEHWIAEIFITDIRTEFIDNKLIPQIIHIIQIKT